MSIRSSCYLHSVYSLSVPFLLAGPCLELMTLVPMVLTFLVSWISIMMICSFMSLFVHNVDSFPYVIHRSLLFDC